MAQQLDARFHAGCAAICAGVGGMSAPRTEYTTTNRSANTCRSPVGFAANKARTSALTVVRQRGRPWTTVSTAATLGGTLYRTGPGRCRPRNSQAVHATGEHGAVQPVARHDRGQLPGAGQVRVQHPPSVCQGRAGGDRQQSGGNERGAKPLPSRVGPLDQPRQPQRGRAEREGEPERPVERQYHVREEAVEHERREQRGTEPGEQTVAAQGNRRGAPHQHQGERDRSKAVPANHKFAHHGGLVVTRPAKPIAWPVSELRN